jgi:hypothetical protein
MMADERTKAHIVEGPALMLFNQDAGECLEQVGGRVGFAVQRYRGLQQGYTKRQGLEFMIRFMNISGEVAEFAVEAPATMSPDEAEGLALRNCLHNAADRAVQ